MKYVLPVLCIIIITVVFTGALVIGTDRQARVDCLELQKQAATYPAYDYWRHTGFFITEYQKAKCDSVHITIKAAVLH